jgi:hypothetical protein
MAKELEISVRRFRELHAMGLPHTRVGATLWYEPAKVHEWLDRFNRLGTPGQKRIRGCKLTGPGATDSAPARRKHAPKLEAVAE